MLGNRGFGLLINGFFVVDTGIDEAADSAIEFGLLTWIFEMSTVFKVVVEGTVTVSNLCVVWIGFGVISTDFGAVFKADLAFAGLEVVVDANKPPPKSVCHKRLPKPNGAWVVVVLGRGVVTDLTFMVTGALVVLIWPILAVLDEETVFVSASFLPAVVTTGLQVNCSGVEPVDFCVCAVFHVVVVVVDDGDKSITIGLEVDADSKIEFGVAFSILIAFGARVDPCPAWFNARDKIWKWN